MTPQEKALLQQNASIGAQPTQSTGTPQPTGDIDFDKMAKKYNVNLPQTKVEPYVPSWKQEQPQQKGFLEMAGEGLGNVLGSTISGAQNIAGSIGGAAQALNPFSDAGFDLGKRAGQLAGAVGQGVQGVAQVTNPFLAEAGKVAAGAVQPTAQSFMGGISKVGEGLKRMGAGDIGTAAGQLARGEQVNLPERGLKDYAIGANTALTGGFQALYSPLAGAMSVAPKEVTGTLAEVGKGIQGIKNAGIGAMGIDPNSEDGKQISDAIDNMMNIAAIGGASAAGKAIQSGAGKIKGALPKGAQDVWNNLDDAVRNTAGKVGGIGAKVGESLSRMGKKAGEFAQDTMANSFFQTPSKVLKQVSAQGDDFLKAWDNKELYQQDVMSKIASSIDDVMSEKGKIGKMYEPLRASNQKVVFKAGYADDVFKKFGLETSPSGAIQPIAGQLKNSRLTEAQLSQLNSRLGGLLPKPGEKFTTDQFLKLRDKVDEIADWGSSVNRADKPVMSAARDIYERLNEIAKKEGGIRGLEGIDKKFSESIKEYKALQKEFMTKDAYGKPVLKPTIQAETVTRLLQPQNKSKLAMLEEYIPDLQKQLQVLDTVKQIEAASMRATGASMQRFGAAAAGGTLGSVIPGVGNALGALAGYLLSDPVQAARWFAKMGARSSKKAGATFENVRKATGGVKGTRPKSKGFTMKDAAGQTYQSPQDI